MTRPLDNYTDIHSHRRSAATDGDTLVCVTPGTPMEPQGHYSVGIHPWDTAAGAPPLRVFKQLVADARLPQVRAIGECGFDRLRGGDIALQTAVFDFQARLAARLELPLVIHCVRAFDLLEAAARRHRPAPGTWIVHGFRGKPATAARLAATGISISLGNRFNPGVPEAVPPERLYRESDAPDEPDIADFTF